jgi:hypothetical protein
MPKEQGGQGADGGERAEDRQPGRAPGPGMQRRGGPGDGHHDELHHQGGLIAAVDLGPDGGDSGLIPRDSDYPLKGAHCRRSAC